MRKKYILLLLIALSLTGCDTNNNIDTQKTTTETQNSPYDEFYLPESSYTFNNFDYADVTIVDDSLSPTTVSLKISYCGENELRLNDWFDLEVYKNEKWYKYPSVYRDGFSDMAYIVEPNKSLKKNYNWEYAYNELPSGNYRIVIKVNHYSKSGDYDEYYLAVPFEIK